MIEVTSPTLTEVEVLSPTTVISTVPTATISASSNIEATLLTNTYRVSNDDIPAIPNDRLTKYIEDIAYKTYLTLASGGTLDTSSFATIDALSDAVTIITEDIKTSKSDYESLYFGINSKLGGTEATVSTLKSTLSTLDSTIATSIETHKAAFSDTVQAYITNVQTSYGSLVSAYNQNLDTMVSTWESQDKKIQGSIESVNEMTDYIGYDPEDSNKTLAESIISFNRTLKLGDYYYATGFGLNSSIKLNGSGTSTDPYSSEFWIKADSLKLIDPEGNGVSPFYIDDGVVYLQNVVIGNTADAITNRTAWNPNTQYYKSDKVQYNGLNYIISVKHISSSSFDKNKVRPDFVSQSVSGVVVSLTVDTPLLIAYNKDGSLYDSTLSSVVYTAKITGYTKPIFYEWYIDDVYKSTTTINTLTVSIPTTFKSSFGKVRVYIKTVEDQLPTKKFYLGHAQEHVKVYKIGSDSYSIIFTDGANTIPASSGGIVSPTDYVNTGARISVFYNDEYLTPEITTDGVPTGVNSFSVKSEVVTGKVTVGVPSITEKEIIYSDISNLETNSCSILHTITVKDEENALLTFEKKQSVAKSKLPRTTLKSTVFARTKLETLPIPTGGDFKSPIPTSVNSDGSKWSDGIPTGKKPLWSCTRIFTDDGLGTQQSAWTTPQLIANTLQSKTQFSVDGASGWRDTASSGDYFMRTCTSDDGGESWSCNSAVKVKGEDGSDGAPGAKGKSVSTGFVYWTSTTTTPSSKPSSGSYNPTTGVVTASVGWNMEPPTVTAGATQASIYYSAYTVLEQDDGSFYVTFKDLKKGTEFSGLVTFTSADDRYADKNLAGVTTIDGDKVITNHITLGTNGQIKSNNFVSGSAGWCIKGNGDIAEFKDVKIYGNIIDSDTDPRFMLGDGGRFLTAASIHAGVPSGDVKLKIDSNANIRLNSDGTARFTKHLNVGPKGAFYASKEGTIGCMYWTSSTQELKPYGTSGTYNLGSPSNQWGTVFADTSSISTSDARKKTDINALNSNELKASIQLSKEFGTFQFLNAIKDKGSNARLHIGMTVQRAIEIMKDNHLDPFAYGFICYDEAGVDELGNNYPDSYGFRYEELLAFISIGFEARLTQLEKGI
jgi:hypothetical protein